MKNSIITAIIFLALCSPFYSLYSQVDYTVTNTTDDWYYVTLRIAQHAVQCYTGTPTSTRTASTELSPQSCGNNQDIIDLQVDEFVYHVEIYRYSTCPSSCTPPTTSKILEGEMDPCITNPDSDSWTNCNSDNAEADRTSYCDIND